MLPGERRLTTFSEHLPWWIAAAVVTGLVFPAVARAETAVPWLLAIMVGSVGLTLDLAAFQRLRGSTLLRVLALQLLPIVLAVVLVAVTTPALGVVLGLILIAVVPTELTAPLMTHLAGGRTALTTAVLLITALASPLTVPGLMHLLVGAPFVVGAGSGPVLLLLAVVLPILAGVTVRRRWRARVAAHDATWPAVAGLMVILVMAIVTGANASLLRGSPGSLWAPGLLVVALLGGGMLFGRVLGPREPAARTASMYTTGMRDFAVAAAYVIATGLPPMAGLVAALYGIVEMLATSALATKGRRGGTPARDT